MIAVDPRLVAPVPGIDSDDPAEIMSRLAFRPHPDDGPRRLGPRPPPRGPARPRGSTRERAVRHRSSRAGRSSTGPGRRGSRAPWRSAARRSGCFAARRPTRRLLAALPAAPPDRRPRPRRGAGVHRPPQPRRPGDPRRAAPRAEGPPGRDDRGHRRRRQRVRPVPDARPTSTTSLILNGGLDGRPDGVAYDWRTVADYLARYDRGVAVNIAYLVGNSALRIAAVGWDEVEASPAQLADQRALLREGMEEGAFGLSTGLDYPPGRVRLDRRARRAPGRGGAKLGGFYHTHVRYPLGDGFLDPFREAIEIGRRSGGGPVHITHFYHRATFPGSAGGHAPARRRRAGRGARRQLRPLPVRVGEHAAPDHAADLGPGRRGREAEGAPRRPGGRGRGSATSWPPGAGCSPGPTRGDDAPARLLRPARAPRVGGPDARRRTWPRPGSTRSTPSATSSSTEDLRVNQVTPGPHRAGIPPFLVHGQAMIGTDGVLIGAKPSPRTYGCFPRILGEFVREERLLEPRGGGPQDDRRAGGPPRPGRPRPRSPTA